MNERQIDILQKWLDRAIVVGHNGSFVDNTGSGMALHAGKEIEAAADPDESAALRESVRRIADGLEAALDNSATSGNDARVTTQRALDALRAVLS
jgi:hypothetical protein